MLKGSVKTATSKGREGGILYKEVKGTDIYSQNPPSM
jgi:hypothetical protein